MATTFPRMFERLTALAQNLWWSWDTEATALWAEVDPFRWERYGHNPVALLRDVEPDRWQALAASPFAARVDATYERFRQYLDGVGWCATGAPALLRGGVAYFSMEFGLHESLHLYSGGLGVLAGDHLRSASDLGVPLIGLSLLYRQGYFRQLIDDGRQIAAYPQANWDRMPIRPCTTTDGRPLEVEVPIGERAVKARVWQLDVGRCRLLLLDTDYDANTPEDRGLTRQLYGGDERMRIHQEVLLGFGGWRALGKLGIEVSVVHLNEGHCAFVPFAAIGEAMVVDGLGFADAVEQYRSRAVFTTHTPVPAGHDRFGLALVTETLGPWATEVGLSIDAVMDLGRVVAGDEAETLCTTVVALRTSAASNGVSALHGEVSRTMWKDLWPELAEADVPIHHVTNGVHPVYWMAPEARALFDAHLPGWREHPWDAGVWAPVAEIPDAVWLGLRRALRSRLCEYVHHETGARFDPDALTIGFARRFAPYKRGDLVFTDPARLERLLDTTPCQLVFAGKAHPRDHHGQDIIAAVVKWSESAAFRDRVVLLPDYGMALGRLITAGADVWLNNPRRPHEASGTSGQKVVLNGGINLSVLDGWWPEGFDGTNGWAIGDGTTLADEAAQDRLDAEALYHLLEAEVLPAWTDRTDGVPRRWIERIRRSVATCAPKFSSHRMVHDYALEIYAPRCR
ncbi:MAG: alpha-glucan family phosphorylase [Myxococcota bacterium]